jgi:hypothetical protein
MQCLLEILLLLVLVVLLPFFPPFLYVFHPIGLALHSSILSMNKWSDNYDFQATRLINPAPVWANEMVEDAAAPNTDIDNIDPQQLGASFTLAVWSSVVLVRNYLPVESRC